MWILNKTCPEKIAREMQFSVLAAIFKMFLLGLS